MSLLVPAWGRSSPAARPAFLAAYYELALGVIVFAFSFYGAVVSMGQSPANAVFGPAKGAPLIAFVYLMAFVVGLQLAVAVALWQRMAWLRWIGSVAAGALALFAVVWTAGWVIWTPLSIGSYLERGGDRGDLIGVLIFTPIIVGLGWLNGRSAMRAIRELRS